MKLFSIDIEAILPAVLTIPILPTACIFISDGNIAIDKRATATATAEEVTNFFNTIVKTINKPTEE